jgi:nucleotide-binding universal stress UspA family protein
MALTLPIEAVGSAASLIFLLTFAMVNLSVIVLRRKYPEIPRKYKVPFYPIVPLAGFILNIFLALYQFKFQPIAWYVTAGWIGVGVLLYYAVFEKKAAAIEPQVLVPRKKAPLAEVEPAVLVALHNPANIEFLLKMAYPIARQKNVRLVAVSVVEVPRQMPIHEGMRLAHHKEALLNQAKKLAAGWNKELGTEIVIAHHTSDGLLTAVQQFKAKALIMGWKGYTNTRDRIFGEVADKIIRLAPCDLMVVKLGEKLEMKNCLLPTAGGPHAKMAASVLNAIAKDHDVSVTAGYVIPEKTDDEQRELGMQVIDATLELVDDPIPQRKEIIVSRSVAGGIAKTSRDYDMVIIGAAREPFFQKVLFGEIPEKVARFSPTTVMVVKKYEGAVKSILKRLLG